MSLCEMPRFTGVFILGDKLIAYTMWPHGCGPVLHPNLNTHYFMNTPTCVTNIESCLHSSGHQITVSLHDSR